MVVVDATLCIFCGACVEVCCESAIRLLNDKKCIEIDEGACVGCGSCVDRCPSMAIKFEQTEHLIG